MRYLLIFLLAVMSIACSEITEPSEAKPKSLVPPSVIGKWQYDSDENNGQKITVTLYPDGSALGSDQSIGSWFYDGDIHIVWMNGWQDLIKKEREKLGYAPGVATSDFPTNRSTAVKVSSGTE